VIRPIAVIGTIETAQDAPGSIFSEGAATPISPCSTTRHCREGDHAIERFRKIEDDVDAVTPVDAQNAPTGVWKSRKEREIPTAPTSIILFSDEEERTTNKPVRSIVHRIGSAPPLEVRQHLVLRQLQTCASASL
jgi:hypothetical protein